MSDRDSIGRSGRKAMDRVREGAEALRDEALEKARDLCDGAAEAIETVKAEGESIMESAQERLDEFVDEQTDAGAGHAQGLARAIHRAAREIEDSAPWMARYVHEAADSVDGMVRSLRDRRPGELVGSLEDLARRQPMAFFGTATLAGFAIARFARSSSAPARGARHHHDGAANREGKAGTRRGGAG